MIKRKSIFLLICAVLNIYPLLSQSSNEKKPAIYTGFSGGVNFTQPVVSQGFGIFSPIVQSQGDDFEKDYDPFFMNFGNQFQFEFWFPIIAQLHLGTRPGLATYNYAYTASNSWIGESPDNSTLLTYNHNQRLRYIEIPLLLRYVYRLEKISPFVHGAFCYTTLLTAHKETVTDLVQQTALGEYPIESQTNSGDLASSYINTRFSTYAGIGAAINLDVVVMTFDANYYFGMNNIVNESHRFSDAVFSGSSYDIQDDLKMDNFVFNLGILFPISQLKSPGSLECIFHLDEPKKRKRK